MMRVIAALPMLARLLLIGSLLGVTVPEAPAQTPKPYPQRGDLYYDGSYYADSYFWWTAVGGWKYNYAGFEMDIVTDEGYFDQCTSWTNLPDPYDDCPTAGASDPEGVIAFGIGSFAAEQILANTTYRGRWWFSGGYKASTFPDVTWQEVSRTLCPYKDIWCYASVQSGRLMTGYWKYLESSYDSWSY